MNSHPFLQQHRAIDAPKKTPLPNTYRLRIHQAMRTSAEANNNEGQAQRQARVEDPKPMKKQLSEYSSFKVPLDFVGQRKFMQPQQQQQQQQPQSPVPKSYVQLQQQLFPGEGQKGKDIASSLDRNLQKGFLRKSSKTITSITTNSDEQNSFDQNSRRIQKKLIISSNSPPANRALQHPIFPSNKEINLSFSEQELHFPKLETMSAAAIPPPQSATSNQSSYDDYFSSTKGTKEELKHKPLQGQQQQVSSSSSSLPLPHQYFRQNQKNNPSQSIRLSSEPDSSSSQTKIASQSPPSFFYKNMYSHINTERIMNSETDVSEIKRNTINQDYSAGALPKNNPQNNGSPRNNVVRYLPGKKSPQVLSDNKPKKILSRVQKNPFNADVSDTSVNISTSQSSSFSDLGQIKNFELRLKSIKESSESIADRAQMKNIAASQTERCPISTISAASRKMSSLMRQLGGEQRGSQPKNLVRVKVPLMQTHLKSKAGQYSLHLRKQNQDSGLIQSNLFGDSTCHLFGVYDGHGEFGSQVSNFIKKSVLKYVMKEIQLQGGLKSENLDIPACLRRAYQSSNQDLLTQNMFDVKLSGCTAVTVLLFRSQVFCANTGDSRAMVSRFTSASEWKPIELSHDHKPELPEEKARINAKGGRVEQSTNEFGEHAGIFRVWKKHEDMPGLAMSRSMGDGMGRECGVIGDPDIMEHTLTNEDKMIVIASDGVWEFISNYEVTKMMAPFHKDGRIKEAADKLVAQSHKEWIKEGDSVDDITCILLFFNGFKEVFC